MDYILNNTRLFRIFIHFIVLMTAFPVHESAHAWAAKKLGDDTAEKAGRISLNPLKHLDPMGTVFMLLIGFGWANPVPVDASRFKNPKNGMAVTALAGPISNLIMAYISMVIFRSIVIISGYPKFGINPNAAGILGTIFIMIVTINISLAVFNLLPIPPLDGSRIFNLFMSDETYFKVMKYERYIFILLFVIMYSGVLDGVISNLNNVVSDAMWFLTGWVDMLFSLFLK